MTSQKDDLLTGKNGRYKAREFAEVTTNVDLIDKQIRLIPKNIILDLSKTVLDPCTGDGRYLMRYLYHRLPVIKSDDDLMKSIQTLYGIELQSENVEMARSNLLACVKAISDTVDLNLVVEILDSNIKQGNFLEGKK